MSKWSFPTGDLMKGKRGVVMGVANDSSIAWGIAQQLAAQGVGEAEHRVLGGAVGRLQRDPPVGQCGADLDDGAAVARAHPLERRHRAPHVAEVGDLGDPPEFLGRALPMALYQQTGDLATGAWRELELSTF